MHGPAVLGRDDQARVRVVGAPGQPLGHLAGAVGTQRAWTAEDGSGRSAVGVVAEALGAKPALGDGDHDQGDEELQPSP